MASVTVWIDNAQLRCCVESVVDGDRVDWIAGAVRDDRWFVDLFGPGAAPTVDYAIEQCDRPRDPPTLSGVVRRINAVHRRYSLTAGGRTSSSPEHGSAELTLVRSADGWDEDRDGRTCIGYLVELAEAVDSSLAS